MAMSEQPQVPRDNQPRPDDSAREIVKRHRLSTRIWHWMNALTVFVMLMSGLMIFNAHPRLYWGQYGANHDYAWLEIGSRADSGYLRVGALTIPTTGVLGYRTEANGKFDAIDKANRRLVYEVVLSEDSGNFKFAKTELPDEAKAKIDEMVAHLKQDPKNIFIEIEGHTDNVGDKLINQKLGLERAEAVQRYLYEQYQIPLHKMNVISYGEDKPIAPNKTREGRAQNRRVVIKVLS